MKNIMLHDKQKLLLLGTIIFFVFAGPGLSRAHDYNSHSGYWDEHHSYHHYDYYNHHHGYWDEREGVRIFINVG